jgi:hypothetical protein
LRQALDMTVKRRWSLGILCIASIGLISGCASECFSPENEVATKEVSCATSASASLTMPDGSKVPTRVLAIGQSCMAGNEVCSDDGFLLLEQISTDTDPSVRIAFGLPVPAGTTPTYALPDPDLAISAGLYRVGDADFQLIGSLSVTGGSFVVGSNTKDELRVAIAMTLETATHERYALVNGSASVSGCRVVAERTECRLQ